MAKLNDPRLRAQLRQADKVAEAGKRAAAAQLYQQILDEAPESDAAWAGLGTVLFEEAEQEAAFEKALALNPANKKARQGLAALRGEPLPEPAQLVPETTEAASAGVEETAVTPPPSPPPPAEETYELVCYRHPDRSTSLRCYSCGRPICSTCARKTPVGYSCPDCIREKEEVFFNANTSDYIIAPLVSLPLSLGAGFLVTQFGGGFFFIFLMIFIGGLVGGFIGRISKRAIGNRRGRYLPHIVAATVVIGVLVWVIPLLLVILFGNPGAFTLLLTPGIYLFTATGAAFYQMK